MARLRTSSHRLNIEVGRYQRQVNEHQLSKAEIMWTRRCGFCCNEDAELLTHLPFAVTPIVEDEQHVLVSCPRYHTLRSSLNNDFKDYLLRNEEHFKLFTTEFVRKMARYVKNIFNTRFPKKS